MSSHAFEARLAVSEVPLPPGLAMTEHNSPPSNPAVRAIAQDVAGATLYSLLAAGADPDAPVRPDSVEQSFRDDVLASLPRSRRQSFSAAARSVTSLSVEGRRALFGRAGERTAADHLRAGGLDGFEDGLPPLALNQRSLGHENRLTFRARPDEVRIDDGRLSMPARGQSEAGLADAGRPESADESDGGLLNADQFLDYFAGSFDGSQANTPFAEGITSVPGRLEHNAVHFELRKIHCLDQTNGWLGGEADADRIQWSAICHGTKGETVNTGKVKAGKFRDGDSKSYSPAKELAKFRADVGTWPWHGTIVFMLAEFDLGGFGLFIEKMYGKIRSAILQKVSEVIQEGLAQYLGSILAGFIGAAVAWALGWVLDWLVDKLLDDVFTPCVVGFRIESEQALRYASNVLGGVTSPSRVFTRTQFGGTYKIALGAALRGNLE